MSRIIYKWIVGVLMVLLAASFAIPMGSAQAQGERIVHIAVAEELSSLNPGHILQNLGPTARALRPASRLQGAGLDANKVQLEQPKGGALHRVRGSR